MGANRAPGGGCFRGSCEVAGVMIPAYAVSVRMGPTTQRMQGVAACPSEGLNSS